MEESLSTPGKQGSFEQSGPGALHRLAAEHETLDSQLQQLNQKRYLSAEEEIEATRLKKLKLHVKDAMNAMQRLKT